MHYLMLVTLTVAPAITSAQVREEVYHQLTQDDSFCGSGGRFGSAQCDWFVVGGRWSGMFAETIIGPAHYEAIIARFPEIAQGFYPQSLVDEHRSLFDSIWREHGGQGASPYTRSSYEELGYDDDAQPLTSQLYHTHLAQFCGESVVTNSSHCQFVDLDGDALSPDFIGRKWLVVVDYHN